MLQQDRIAEFITTLITHADDEDIKTFLGYFANKLPKPQFGYSNHKTLLIGYLFQYIYGHIETNASEIVNIVSKWDDFILPEHLNYPNNLIHYEPLYLHLYALCECFYSYKMLNQSEKNLIQKILETTDKSLTKNIECPATVKNNSTTKLLKLLINSYKENGFYYFFYDDTLVKLTIHRCKKSLYNEQSEDEKEYEYPSAKYKYTKLKLEDRGNKTYITDGKNINESLGSYLTRARHFNKDRESIKTLDDVENLAKDLLKELTKTSAYDTAKNLHKKIVTILKKIPSKKPRKDKLCEEKNIKNLNNKYEVILKKLQKAQNLIIDDEPEEIIRAFKDIDFNEELFTNYAGLTIYELNSRNKEYLEKTLTDLLRCLEKADDECIYNKLELSLRDVKLSIEQYLDVLL